MIIDVSEMNGWTFTVILLGIVLLRVSKGKILYFFFFSSEKIRVQNIFF